MENPGKSTNLVAIDDMLPPFGSSCRVVKERQTININANDVDSVASISHDVDQGFRSRDPFLALWLLTVLSRAIPLADRRNATNSFSSGIFGILSWVHPVLDAGEDLGVSCRCLGSNCGVDGLSLSAEPSELLSLPLPAWVAGCWGLSTSSSDVDPEGRLFFIYPRPRWRVLLRDVLDWDCGGQGLWRSEGDKVLGTAATRQAVPMS